LLLELEAMRRQIKWVSAVCAVFVLMGVKTAWSASMWPDHFSAPGNAWVLMMDRSASVHPFSLPLVHTLGGDRWDARPLFQFDPGPIGRPAGNRTWLSLWSGGNPPLPPDHAGRWIDLDGYLRALDMPAVVPLPPAILLFLTALGALFGIARLRKQT
jgi:hypothetical protein